MNDYVRHRTLANPFVEIEPAHRHIIVAYFIFWQFLPDAVTLFRSHSDSDTVLGFTLAFEFARNLLLLFPFLVSRWGGIPMGWLNPLALSSMLFIVKDIIKEPMSLFAPIVVWLQAPTRLEHRLLMNWPLEETQWVSMTVTVWFVVGMLSYYAGFAAWRGHLKPKEAYARPDVPSAFFVAIWALLAAGFVALLVMRGGLIAHMSSLVQGRFNVREDVGPLLVIIQFMPFLLVLWYLHRPEAMRSLLFWALLLGTLAMQFVANGSRSSVIIPIVVLVAGWMFRERRVPAVGGFVLAGCIVFLLAVLGDIRNSPLENEGSISFDAVTSFDVGQAVDEADEEMRRRKSQSGAVAIAALVPEKHGFIYGETYIGGLLFFVPRTIWEEKPRGPGAYVHAILFKNRKGPEGFRGASFPPSPHGEAYWNFGWPGIIVIFALFGLFNRWLAEKVLQQPDNIKAISMLLIGVVLFDGPQTDSFVAFAQVTVLLLLTLKASQILFPRRERLAAALA